VDIKKQFGLNVKKKRLELGLSQEKLAHIAQIDRTYLPGIEKGERNVSIVVASRIADALNVDFITLFQ
jgi:transcriptional regulator with XRE-family HTH domain